MVKVFVASQSHAWSFFQVLCSGSLCALTASTVLEDFTVHTDCIYKQVHGSYVLFLLDTLHSFK